MLIWPSLLFLPDLLAAQNAGNHSEYVLIMAKDASWDFANDTRTRFEHVDDFFFFGLSTVVTLENMFPYLRTVGSSVILRDLQNLTTLDNGFAALEQVDEHVQIKYMPDLQHVTNGFSQLDKIGSSLGITDDPNLLTVSNGFEHLRIIGKTLHIKKNTLLHTIGPFLRLESITDNLRIEGNDMLLRADSAFPELTYLGMMLSIADNPVLENLSMMAPNLTQVGLRTGQLNVSFRIENNPSLATLTGAFPNLQKIYGRVYIYNNANLLDLAALDNIVCHGGVYEDTLDYCEGCSETFLSLPSCECYDDPEASNCGLNFYNAKPGKFIKSQNFASAEQVSIVTEEEEEDAPITGPVVGIVSGTLLLAVVIYFVVENTGEGTDATLTTQWL